ncbi:MAG: TorF family putative porin, partial [Gammaproteobacteria bacterium]|nr:TorF family putative porin [Gammaproteobacteria bacterium]
VGIIDYEYFDDNNNPNILEIYAGLSYSIVSGTLYYGIDNELGVDSGTDNYIWLEGAVEYDFGPAALAGTVGLFESDDFDDEYVGWSVGVSTEALGLGFDLTYHDTDSDGEDLFGTDIAGDRVVFTVSKEL